MERAAELIQCAGLGQVSWETALEGLAAVTGSAGAQLIGLGSRATVPFNLMTGAPPEAGAEFISAGGGDPAVNSRIRIGQHAAELRVLDETAFTTADDMRRSPEYAAWCHRYDLHSACVTNLVKEPDQKVGMALLRSAGQGNVSYEQKRAFAVLAIQARAAVRTQMALEAQGAKLLAGAIEAIGALAFVCDAAGRVCGLTASAETLLSGGDVLRLKGGVLTTACEASRRGFEAALAQALAGGAPPCAVAVRRLLSDDRLFLEAAPLPRSGTLHFGPRALIIVRGSGADEVRVAGAARSLYGLSASEAVVAAQLAAGLSPAAIAHRRQVAVGTVRTQVRQIYQKVGVSSQLELVARLPRL
ncbi:helix-turn-helix transcriptional regulator [Brevundimonas sp.]|uniref:helix-turn-helix transcriptional regulator n=1 Tax=Brevundimonas sp. TaxID=1871086 RepID=UPI0039194F91